MINTETMKKTYIQPDTCIVMVKSKVAMLHASFSNSSNHYQGGAEENTDEDFEAGAKRNNLWGSEWDE